MSPEARMTPVLLCFACAVAMADAALPETLRVHLKWYHQFQFAGFYAADFKGYYADEGLQVEIVEGSPKVRPIDAVLSGNAEFGVMGGGLLVERLNGAPVVALAALFQHSPLILLSLEESGIRRPADLIGRRVMISDGYDEAEILAMLAAEGIPLERINILPHSWNLDDLIERHVDAVGAYIIDQPYQIRRRGLAYQLIEPQNYGIDFYGDTLFTSERFLNEKRRLVEDFRRATLRGWEYALAHPEEVISHILQLPTTRPAPLEIDGLRHEAREIEKLMLPGLVEIGHMNPGRWRRMADVYVVLGFAHPGYSLEGFQYDDRQPQGTMLWLLGLAAFAGGVALVVLGWNYQLRRLVRKRTRELQSRTTELEAEIRERRVAEAEQQRLIEVLELCPDYVGITDALGQTIYINRHGRLMLGIAHDEDISGEFFSQYHPMGETERFQREVFPAVARDGFWVGESVFRDRGGREFPVSQMILAHKDEKGEIRNFSTIARDVTRQKMADQAFQELQRTLVTLMGNLPGMAYRCVNDRNWTMIFASGGARELTGYEPNELIDNREIAYNDLIVPSDREGVWEQVQRAVSMNKPYRLIYRIRSRDGREKWVWEQGTGVRGKDGELAALEGFICDISERQNAEAALRASEQRFRLLAENIPGVVYLCTHGEQKNIIYLNDAIEALTGYRKEEFLEEGMYLENLWHPEDAPAIRTQMQQALERRDAFHLCYRIRHAQGGWRWVEEHGVGVWEGERLHFLEGVLLDVTARCHAEEEAARARSYLHQVLDSLPSMLIAVDRDGKIKHWNCEAAAFTGVAQPEALDTDVFSRLPWLCSLREVILQAMRSGIPVKHDLMQRDRGGVRRTYDVSIFPIASPDNSGAVIRIDDITQRLQVEQLMMRSEKMTMVAGLAAGMAHELNNPLGTVLQSVQNIHRRLSMELPENHLAAEEVHVALEDVHRYLERREVPDFLDAIQEAGGRAAQIISDMLSFSRTGNTEPRLVQLRHTIARAVRLVQAGYAHGNPEQAAHFEVVLDIDEEVPEVRCDENKIEQVLLNLVSNAAQALAEVDDKRPRIITIRLRSEPYAIRIDVEDNGPGMSDEVRQRIFEPFFTTKGGGEGTGLGLSVSYFLVVDLHGGSLEVESEPGHGACFILRLPR